MALKIVELLDDPARRAAMGAYGRRRVQDELEWRHEAPKLLAAYEALWPTAARALTRYTG
jgi:glycosyltransferase involved in cell wall biosynthesis